MSLEPLHNEQELLLRIAEGDEQAFTALFNAYKHKVYTIALKIVKEETIAEEIVQDVFLKLWLHRTRLPQVDYFTAYLFTSVRNHGFTAIKRIARRSATITPMPGDADLFPQAANEDIHLKKENWRLLQQAIELLPPQQGKVYRLVKIEGMNQAEVASMLQVSPHTVKNQLQTAMRKVRSYCITWMEINILIIFLVH